MNDNFTDGTCSIDAEIDEFLLDRQVQRVSPDTLAWHRRGLGKWRAYCIEHGVSATEQTTPKLLRAFIAHLEARGHNEGGVVNIYGSVKAFLLWYEHEYEPTNWKSPTHKVKVRVPKPPLLEPVSLEHFLAMVATCDAESFTGRRDLAILYTLLDSGVRHQELTDLIVSDVNLATGEVLVRHGKGGKRRSVFVGTTARQAIANYLQVRNGPLSRYLRRRNRISESDALWLTDQSSPLTKAGMRQVIRRRAKRAGVPFYGLHAFRRAFAINSLRNGMDVITLQRLMGHNSLEVTTRYLKLVTADLATAHTKYGVVDHLYLDAPRPEHSTSSREQPVIAANGSVNDGRPPGKASEVKKNSAPRRAVPPAKTPRPLAQKGPSRKAVTKPPALILCTLEEHLGKRPARLNR